MSAEPEAFIFATNASLPPALLTCIGDTVGKSVESVLPVMYAFPELSTAMP